MTTPADAGDLQFDSVIPRADGATTATACVLCHAPFDDEYFDVNGQQICRACSEKVVYQTATPREMRTFVRAGLAGLVAAVLGAALYFAVIAISGFEVGLVSIAIGYMVGYGVRSGTRGRGGRRFQVLAVVLTYWAVGLAYSTLAIKAFIAGAPFALSLLYVTAFSFVMPVLAIAGDMPGGLLSGAIIVFGMVQAWKMTAAPVVTVTGPYRIAAPAAS